ncbi:MAG: hypothetical protein F7C35_08235 [Desulfurococcales archaeon]|nr:hypothetical protein [Desulfurococcales archaeon]
MASICSTAFLRFCLEEGFCNECFCNIDYKRIITYMRVVESHIGSVISYLDRNKRVRSSIYKLDFKYNCMFKKPVYELIKSIRERIEECEEACITDKSIQRHCPEYIYCDEKKIAELYTIRNARFKNPDYLIISSAGVTMIIEEKENPGSKSLKRLRDQLESSYNNIPNHLKKQCTFIVLLATRKRALPYGLSYDKITRFITYNNSRALLPVPVIYLPLGLQSIIKI